jgi:hypothetical protein
MDERTVLATAVLTTGGALDAVTVAVAELLATVGSGVLELTLAVLAIVTPFTTLQLRFATTVNVAMAPLGMLPSEHVIVPPAPTGGSTQVQPFAGECETKVVPADRLSVRVTAAALFGPLLMRVIV